MFFRRRLKLRSLNLLSRRSDENRAGHRTGRFACDEAVLRRGQHFRLHLQFNKAYEAEKHALALVFDYGSHPCLEDGTRALLRLDLQDAENGAVTGGSWTARVTESCGSDVTVVASATPDAPVGLYRCYVLTDSPGGKYKSRKTPVYLLFNPWCKGDSVYLPSEEQRDEYVLNDSGVIFHGSASEICTRSWFYGQFESGVLDACLFVLDRGGCPYAERGDPISVVRTIAATVNANDENGVLVGKWSEKNDYSGGACPDAWSGSVEILRRFKRKRRPVSYAQCWVFSGTTTAVLRCLGIPARTVTNYASAHDTDGNMTTDIIVDENMEAIEKLTKDSVWNFHSWSDCWLQRPDLPRGYGGWQAVDATPQQRSEGVYRCGPASLKAVKMGHVHLPYDTKFVFAEVNSDRIFWQRGTDGVLRKVNVESDSIGQFISTKAVGSASREDITHLYKFPEGSREERMAVERALRFGSGAALHGDRSSDQDTASDDVGPCSESDVNAAPALDPATAAVAGTAAAADGDHGTIAAAVEESAREVAAFVRDAGRPAARSALEEPSSPKAQETDESVGGGAAAAGARQAQRPAREPEDRSSSGEDNTDDDGGEVGDRDDDEMKTIRCPEPREYRYRRCLPISEIGDTDDDDDDDDDDDWNTSSYFSRAFAATHAHGSRSTVRHSAAALGKKGSPGHDRPPWRGGGSVRQPGAFAKTAGGVAPYATFTASRPTGRYPVKGEDVHAVGGADREPGEPAGGAAWTSGCGPADSASVAARRRGAPVPPAAAAAVNARSSVGTATEPAARPPYRPQTFKAMGAGSGKSEPWTAEHRGDEVVIGAGRGEWCGSATSDFRFASAREFVATGPVDITLTPPRAVGNAGAVLRLPAEAAVVAPASAGFGARSASAGGRCWSSPYTTTAAAAVSCAPACSWRPPLGVGGIGGQALVAPGQSPFAPNLTTQRGQFLGGVPGAHDGNAPHPGAPLRPSGVGSGLHERGAGGRVGEPSAGPLAHGGVDEGSRASPGVRRRLCEQQEQEEGRRGDRSAYSGWGAISEAAAAVANERHAGARGPFPEPRDGAPAVTVAGDRRSFPRGVAANPAESDASGSGGGGGGAYGSAGRAAGPTFYADRLRCLLAENDRRRADVAATRRLLLGGAASGDEAIVGMAPVAPAAPAAPAASAWARDHVIGAGPDRAPLSVEAAGSLAPVAGAEFAKLPRQEEMEQTEHRSLLQQQQQQQQHYHHHHHHYYHQHLQQQAGQDHLQHQQQQQQDHHQQQQLQQHDQHEHGQQLQEQCHHQQDHENQNHHHQQQQLEKHHHHHQQRRCRDVAVAVFLQEGIVLGSNFAMLVRVTSLSDEVRSVSVQLRGHVVTLMGKTLGVFKEESFAIVLCPFDEQDALITVTPGEYMDLLADRFAMMVMVSASVAETGRSLHKLHTFRLRDPHLLRSRWASNPASLAAVTTTTTTATAAATATTAAAVTAATATTAAAKIAHGPVADQSCRGEDAGAVNVASARGHGDREEFGGVNGPGRLLLPAYALYVPLVVQGRGGGLFASTDCLWQPAAVPVRAGDECGQDRDGILV